MNPNPILTLNPELNCETTRYSPCTLPVWFLRAYGTNGFLRLGWLDTLEPSEATLHSDLLRESLRSASVPALPVLCRLSLR